MMKIRIRHNNIVQLKESQESQEGTDEIFALATRKMKGAADAVYSQPISSGEQPKNIFNAFENDGEILKAFKEKCIASAGN